MKKTLDQQQERESLILKKQNNNNKKIQGQLMGWGIDRPLNKWCWKTSVR